MFDLETAIRRWRRQLAANGMTSGRVLAELESHLRDDIEAGVQSGMTTQQAFQSAVKQIGSGTLLNAEFSKITDLAESRRRKFVFICGILPALAGGLVVSIDAFAGAMSVVERLVAIAAVGLIAVYICSLAFIHTRLFSVRAQRIRLTDQIACTAAWVGCGAAIMAWVLPSLNLASNRSLLVLWLIVSAVPVLVWITYRRRDHRGPLPPGADPFHPFAPAPLPPTRPVPPEVEFIHSHQTPFAPVVQRSLELAHHEANRFHHDYVGTEHVLLGLLSAGQSGVSGVLKRLGLADEVLRGEINKFITCGSPAIRARECPYTPRALRALKLAIKEASRLNQPRIEAGHVLLGLLREGEGVAALALRNLGIRIEMVRQIIKQDAYSVKP